MLTFETNSATVFGVGWVKRSENSPLLPSTSDALGSNSAEVPPVATAPAEVEAIIPPPSDAEGLPNHPGTGHDDTSEEFSSSSSEDDDDDYSSSEEDDEQRIRQWVI